MKILGNRILVRRTLDLSEVKSNFGILLPEMSKDKDINNSVAGIVVQLGNGEKMHRYDIKENDEILYSEATSLPITIDNEKYDLVRVQDVIASFGAPHETPTNP